MGVFFYTLYFLKKMYPHPFPMLRSPRTPLEFTRFTNFFSGKAQSLPFFYALSGDVKKNSISSGDFGVAGSEGIVGVVNDTKKNKAESVEEVVLSGQSEQAFKEVMTSSIE